MKRVAVTGASGFVGRALVARLRERGDEVIPLSRRPNANAFDGADALVHLAGEPVSGRWTAQKKAAIRQSRVAGTRALVQALGACARPPSVLVSASASGYYGSRGDESLDEFSIPGQGFLAEVCASWEREAQAARSLGVRVACLRTGIVLGSDGGALPAMLNAFRSGFGGPFGGGAQFFPWIHIDDLVSLYLFAIDRDEVAGAVNAVTPDYATNARFAQALGNALGRPALVPAPRLALQLLLGEFAQTLLDSQLYSSPSGSDCRIHVAPSQFGRCVARRAWVGSSFTLTEIRKRAGRSRRT